MRQTVALLSFCALLGCSVGRDEQRGDARVARARIRAAALPSPPTTFFLAAPITEAPDHSGRYVMRRSDSSAYFTPRGFALSLAGGTKRAPLGWTLSASVVGANDVAPIAEHERKDKVHSYVGDPSKWQHDMPTYGQLAWEEIRPGVDMIVEPSPAGFSYRFVLSEGASVTDLALRWESATALRVVDEGRGVDVETDLGVLHVSGLHAFAVEGDRRIELPARHVVHGNDVGVAVDGWDGRTPLVIDPTVAWSSIGGGGSSAKVAVDGSGNVLVTGEMGGGFPTSGGFDATFDGGRDAFVMKVSSAGVLLWSSYLGGTKDDWGAGIAVDASGNAFITGRTYSTDFPSAGGFQATNRGIQDAFITKVSASGALLWSSYLGGSVEDAAWGIAVDGSGNAFVTGQTSSTDFPSSGGFSTTNGGDIDAFVTKVSGAGVLLWSSYLGGTSSDYAAGIAVDGSGTVFVTGTTFSTNFPTTGGFDTSLGSSNDAFVSRISASGTLLWSSYLGGSSWDSGTSIAVDSSGNCFLTGTTLSTDFPSSGGFQPTLASTGGTSDAFVTKVSSAGAVVWSSYLGGSTFDGGGAVTVDGSGNAIVVGDTSSSDYPTLAAFQPSYAGGGDAYVTKVSGAGALLWSSYLGGSNAEEGLGVAVDGTGNTFVAGLTYSSDFPSGGVSKAFFSYGTEKFIANLKPATAPAGASCTSAGACVSGFCVDGVCCDKACAGRCEACTAAKKGGGVDGTCANAAADTNPKGECAAGTGTCPADGLCDGAGACRLFAKAGTPCGETTCSGGMVAGKICTGSSDTCADSPGATCAPFACGAAACKTTCVADGDCATDSFCTTTGTCVPKALDGTPCTMAHECGSGLCADGVCCDAACDGTCESCNEPGQVGSCVPVTGEPRGARPRCDALAADDCAKKTCDGNVRAGCAAFVNGATTSCGADTCTADQRFQAKGTCDGLGACTRSAPVACGAYACATTGCKSSCTADTDCAKGLVCDRIADACVPAPPPRPPAETAAEDGGCSCQTGPRHHRGALAPISLLLISALRRRRARA